MEEKIQVKEEKVLNFYDEIGSKHFQLQGKVLEKYGGLKLDIYFKSIGFVISVLGIVGIIAGFGFTAFSYIQSKLLFFLGEGILAYGIIKGIVWVQSIYSNEFDSLDAEFTKHKIFYEERNRLFMIVYEQLIDSKHEINIKDLENLQTKDNESLTLFKPTKEVKPQFIYSKELYICLFTGTIALFSSFFICDLLHFLFC